MEPDFVFPLVGRTAILDALLPELVVYLHLYTAPVPIVDGIIRADLVEPYWPGYLPLKVPTWTPASLRGTLAEAFSDPAIFTVAEGYETVPIYGYFATMGPSGPLLWVTRRSVGPFVLNDGMPSVVIIARMTFPACPLLSADDAFIIGDGLDVAGGWELPPS